MEVQEYEHLVCSWQIWRLLISESDILIIENRDKEKKEVSYSAFDLSSKKYLWKDFQPEEKFWIGIEKIQNDVIYFHKFAKPDMPAHRGIIALDIKDKKVLWKREDVIFTFIYENKLYAIKDDFYGDNILILNAKTGEEIERIKSSDVDTEAIGRQAMASEDFSDYKFPEIYYNNSFSEERAARAFKAIKEKKNVDIVGNFEYTMVNNLILTSFHVNNGEKMENIFCIFDEGKNKIIFEKTLNEQIELFAADTFFVYKDLLILLKQQREIIIYKLRG